MRSDCVNYLECFMLQGITPSPMQGRRRSRAETRLKSRTNNCLITSSFSLLICTLSCFDQDWSGHPDGVNQSAAWNDKSILGGAKGPTSFIIGEVKGSAAHSESILYSRLQDSGVGMICGSGGHPIYICSGSIMFGMRFSGR